MSVSASVLAADLEPAGLVDGLAEELVVDRGVRRRRAGRTGSSARPRRTRRPRPRRRRADSTASAQTIVGLFPPSSISIFRGPAAAVILAAVVGPPVNDTRAMRSSVTSDLPGLRAAADDGDPPRGTPAETRSSTKANAVRGVWSEGFRTTPLPAIRAGPSLCATRLRGSLKEVSAAMTPTGSRVNQPTRFPPVPAGCERDRLSLEVHAGLGGQAQCLHAAGDLALCFADGLDALGRRSDARIGPASCCSSRAALCRHSLRAHSGQSSVEIESWTPDTAAATSAGVESAT